MTRQELAKLGQRRFGPQWKSPLARAVGLSYQAILAYMNGRAIPPPVAIAIRCVVAHREPVKSRRRLSAPPRTRP